jgi:Protein of unknown function, DUF488
MADQPARRLQQASVRDARWLAQVEGGKLGVRVLVMRIWPRGLSWEDIDLWLPDAGPSLDLLRAYHAGEFDWDEFARRYRLEQRDNWRHAGYYKVGEGETGKRTSQLSPSQHILELLAEHGTLTVFCEEKVGHCHRYELMDLVCEKDGKALPLIPDGSTRTVLVQRGVDNDPLVSAEGEVYAPFAIVREDGWWKLYHLKSALSLCSLVKKTNAIACAKALRILPEADWSFDRPDAFLGTPGSAQAYELVQSYEREDGWIFREGVGKVHPAYRQPG